jgi:hypothetical protein
VALVPLLEVQAWATRSGSSVPVCQFHFSMAFWSSSSRNRSPSHQMAKLQECGLAPPILTPLQE